MARLVVNPSFDGDTFGCGTKHICAVVACLSTNPSLVALLSILGSMIPSCTDRHFFLRDPVGTRSGSWNRPLHSRSPCNYGILGSHFCWLCVIWHSNFKLIVGNFLFWDSIPVVFQWNIFSSITCSPLHKPITFHELAVQPKLLNINRMLSLKTQNVIKHFLLNISFGTWWW